MQKNEIECWCFAGPLNLNRQKKEACTVMGTKLELEDEEFDALDKLVSMDGKPVSAEQLYSEIWETGDDVNKRNSARLGMNNIMNKVNDAGEGFMRIDYDPVTGYAFSARWGSDFQEAGNSEISDEMPEAKKIRVIETNKKLQRHIFKSVVAVGVTVLLLAMVTVTMLVMPVPSGKYIEHSSIGEPNVPAGAGPGND